MYGVAAHIGDSPLKKNSKLFFFFGGKVLDQLLFNMHDGLMHGMMTFQTFALDVDSFVPAVIGIRPEPNKPFLFQPGQKTGNGWVTQMEGFFDIPGTGRFCLLGQKTHHMALGSG